MSECFSETEDFVFGTKGTAKILANSIKGETNWQYEGKKPSMYELEHVALMNSIRRGEALNNGDYMSKSTLMAIMGREAAYSGEVITWKDLMESDMKLGPDRIAWGEAPEVVVPMPGRYRFKEE
jgi:hypothetical protein